MVKYFLKVFCGLPCVDGVFEVGVVSRMGWRCSMTTSEMSSYQSVEGFKQLFEVEPFKSKI